MEKEGLVEDNLPEDVRWLLSLSESELDLLITLKKLVIQCAETLGHEALAKKFNLKMLRVLGFIVMQYVKNKVKDLSIPGLSDSKTFLNASNLLNLMVGVNSMDNGDLVIDGPIDQRKRKFPRSSGELLSSSKRLKSIDSENP